MLFQFFKRFLAEARIKPSQVHSLFITYIKLFIHYKCILIVDKNENTQSAFNAIVLIQRQLTPITKITLAL